MAPPDDHAETLIEPLLTVWRVRVVLAVAFTAFALVATAYADPREELARQLAAEAESIDRALRTVTEKLGLIDRDRGKRLVAAGRALDRPSVDPMATARRRAAARLLLDRDLVERRLLADETALLRAAAARTAGDAAKIAELELPPPIGKPARGSIARSFGTIKHERSKTILARRGIDLEVDTRAPVKAPADGVVRYAGPIRGLERGVILDHGSYFTVVAKLGEVAVPVGARVAQGDRLGRAARHRVYLEVRVKLGPGGRPIDPEPLLR
jgi:septal ring factor EnvC (AmiA/AmiB activator)